MAENLCKSKTQERITFVFYERFKIDFPLVKSVSGDPRSRKNLLIKCPEQEQVIRRFLKKNMITSRGTGSMGAAGGD